MWKNVFIVLISMILMLISGCSNDNETTQKKETQSGPESKESNQNNESYKMIKYNKSITMEDIEFQISDVEKSLEYKYNPSPDFNMTLRPAKDYLVIISFTATNKGNIEKEAPFTDFRLNDKNLSGFPAREAFETGDVKLKPGESKTRAYIYNFDKAEDADRFYYKGILGSTGTEKIEFAWDLKPIFKKERDR